MVIDGKFLVIESEQVQDRGVPVRHTDLVFNGREAQLVSGAVQWCLALIPLRPSTAQKAFLL